MKKRVLFTVFLVLVPESLAHADVVWPALYLEVRLMSVWPIITGLLIELFLLKFAFGFTFRRAIIADVVMNAISALVGLVFIPFAGFLWELLPGLLLTALFKLGTFNRVTWCATFLLAVAVNTIIKAAVLQYGFEMPFSKRNFGLLLLANFASVGVAFVSLWLKPLHI